MIEIDGSIINENENIGIDWEQAKEKATKHPDQNPTNGDIGIGIDGEPVNLDLWVYSLTWEKTILLGDEGGSGYEPGYNNANIVNGKIQGKMPQYIKPAGEDEFYPVTDLFATFYGCSSLVIAPEIPDTATKMYGTFQDCSGLIEAPVIKSGVTSLENTFYNCYNLKGDLIINAESLNRYTDCLNGATTSPDATLYLSGSSEYLSQILETKSEESNISFKN